MTNDPAKATDSIVALLNDQVVDGDDADRDPGTDVKGPNSDRDAYEVNPTIAPER